MYHTHAGVVLKVLLVALLLLMSMLRLNRTIQRPLLGLHHHLAATTLLGVMQIGDEFRRRLDCSSLCLRLVNLAGFCLDDL